MSTLPRKILGADSITRVDTQRLGPNPAGRSPFCKKRAINALWKVSRGPDSRTAARATGLGCLSSLGRWRSLAPLPQA